MWTKTFTSQTNVLHWCGDKETLFVGLDNGEIYQLFIPKEFNHMRYQEVPFYPTETKGILKAHSKRVMGLHADPILGYLYSVGEDGHLRVTSLKDAN